MYSYSKNCSPPHFLAQLEGVPLVMQLTSTIDHALDWLMHISSIVYFFYYLTLSLTFHFQNLLSPGEMRNFIISFSWTKNVRPGHSGLLGNDLAHFLPKVIVNFPLHTCTLFYAYPICVSLLHTQRIQSIPFNHCFSWKISSTDSQWTQQSINILHDNLVSQKFFVQRMCSWCTNHHAFLLTVIMIASVYTGIVCLLWSCLCLCSNCWFFILHE